MPGGTGGMRRQSRGWVFAHLDAQTLLFDFELREVVLAHEIEDLLQLIDVDGQGTIVNLSARSLDS
jgi:hypothetical protein